MRNSLNLVFKQRFNEETLKPMFVLTERLVRVKSSSTKKIISSRNDSRTRLDAYTNQIDSAKSFSELVKNNSYEHKAKKTQRNGLAISSMNSLPILEGLWTKKIEKYYKK